MLRPMPRASEKDSTGHSGRVGIAPRSGQDRRGDGSPDDRGPVEELHHAGTIHRAPGCTSRRGGQVLP